MFLSGSNDHEVFFSGDPIEIEVSRRYTIEAPLRAQGSCNALGNLGFA